MAEVIRETDFLPPQTYPWLAITEDSGESTTTSFYSLSSDKLLFSGRQMVPPEHRILTSSRGWLLLMDTRTSLCHLSNIHSGGATINLPAEPIIADHHRACNSLLYFSDDDEGGPARVILVHCEGIWFCNCNSGVADDRYVKTRLVPDTCGRLIGGAIRRGELYVAAEVTPEEDGRNARVLMRFDFNSLAATEITRFDALDNPINYDFQTHLFESVGDLFLVYRLYFYDQPQLCGFIIRQYRFETNTVVELKDLGGRRLFLGHGTVFSSNDSVLCTEPGIHDNSIYFLEPNNKFLHLYSLVDDSLLMTLPNPQINNSSSVSLDWIVL